MPVRSRAQLKWLGKNHPDWIKEWTKGQGISKLPDRLSAKKTKSTKGQPNIPTIGTPHNPNFK